MYPLPSSPVVRLALACVVWKHPHLLVLDEVTMHLDLYTVRALARALRQFNGALLVVSHDRLFIKSVIEGNAQLLGLDEDEPADSDENERAEMQQSQHLIKNGKLIVLEHGVQDFEESLGKKVENLLS
ncbi:hypothetical protein QQZ08_012090 [Neonectria magnoliae]|uniref:ABC transporter domain-containing protein n=1 Tax=Neonectria magnoliae TaxID=2732573 RepID=A0ABR1H5F8_9HYPO